ncbi:MAG TPA: toxin-antitoxin system HicB family antitoxin [Baekduia sp.]|uniref:FitA-like ribbon-helix-helix domain-containing protein n=1 Tax=Baekduia sp. TaxID=2600305 RepID=UPI002D79BD40|nr:toxin-antitoxin system HicB family antitoxin [Baekduia sp.]HET6505725.1 toxin-antitoxin system HicB family antitoxin [Baekduia sp.]
MATVQIRNVPEEVHRRLKVEAAESGQSLNEYLLWRLMELADRPTFAELARRIHEREEPYTGPSSVELIRAERDRRG